MAVKLIKVNGIYDTNISVYEVDTEADKNGMDTSGIEQGSKVHIIETDKTYILDGQKQWSEIVENSIVNAENIVSATAAMTPAQAAQTRQNIGADTPETVTKWLNDHVNPDTGYVIDNSLTIEGAAADAKTTGNAVGELKSALDTFYIDTDDHYIQNWTQGYIKKSDGSTGSGNDFCYTANGIVASNVYDRIKIIVKSGFKVACYKYSNDGSTYLGQAFAFVTGTYEFLIESGKRYKFNLGKNDGSNILVANVPNDVLFYTYEAKADPSLTQENFPADAKATGEIVNRLAVPFMNGSMLTTGQSVLTYSSYYTYRKLSKMVQVEPSAKVKMTFDSADAQNIGNVRIYFYIVNNSNIEFSSTKLYSLTNGSVSFDVPNNVKYIYAMIIPTVADRRKYEPVIIQSDNKIKEVFLPNINNSNFGNICFAYNTFEEEYTSGQLLLPPNYSVDGQKVPLYVVLHGTTSMNTWDEAIGNNDGTSTKYLLQYMANEGFAVFDCYPFTSKYYKESAQIASAPLPVIKRAYEEGIKYVCEHYNVDINNVCFSAFSLGGQLGYYFAGSSPIVPKAVAMFAPSIGFASVIFNTYFLRESGRQLVVDALGLGEEENVDTFIETTEGLESATVRQFVLDHLDRFAGFIGYAENVHGATFIDQYNWMITPTNTMPQWMQDLNIPSWPSGWTNGVPSIINHPELSKYNRVPLKYWGAFDDVNTSTHANYTIYQWLKNGGTDVQWRTLPNGGGGHHAIDTSPTAEKVSGTTRLGIAYSDIAVAYKEMADFFYYHMGSD